MSICIISDHIIIKFQYNTQHIDQVKPKMKGGASAPKAPPGSAPGQCPLTFSMLSCQIKATTLFISQLTLPLSTGICAKGYASMEHCMNQYWERMRSIFSNRAVT